MTRDEMKRLLDSPVMRAWADGGTLQLQMHGGEWVDVEPTAMTPNIQHLQFYRIKPEPKYRPWTPEEAVKHLGKHVNSIYGGRNRVLGIYEDTVLLLNGGRTYYKEMLCSYVTEDGKPCGTEVVDAG